ncbi:MAG: DinB family protein, partial [Chloroflexi bacterium]|nr:DinB family protein [Chloroflexota bacterium]
WNALNAALGRLTEAQMTTIRDPQGWTVKDHLIHLAAWERGSVFFLQGKPRHEGIGVGETLYLTGSDDEINDAIFQQRKDLPLDEALAHFRDVHQQMMAALQPLTDADLKKPYRHYLPNDPGEGDGPPAIKVIYGNSAHHFADHLGWIEALVAG